MSKVLRRKKVGAEGKGVRITEPRVTVNGAAEKSGRRAPAVPLLVLDPFFSVWSMADTLTKEFPRHWTGSPHSLTGMVRVDGKAWRFIGPQPEDVPAAKQLSVEVLPTRTIYVFRCGAVELTLTFMSPSLPANLHILSWPVGYVTFSFRSLNGKAHKVELYFDVCAELVVNATHQHVAGSRLFCDGATVLSFGTVSQGVLASSGDDHRIDWGYFYMVCPKAGEGEEAARTCISPKQDIQESFAQTGEIPGSDDLDMPRAVSDQWPALMARYALEVPAAGAVQRHVLLIYDDLFSVEYLHRKLRPYWNRSNMGVSTLINAAVREYAALTRRCEAFDAELMADLASVGGEHFAYLCALAFRQTLAGHKLCADVDGSPMYFSKENFSNGCIATVDVTYPSAPFFLLLNPVLLEGQLTPIFQYASTPRWRFPYAPHDLGTYPLANRQVYGGGERSEKHQMPVEECGNMILLTAALAKAHGHLEYVKKYWGLLTKWAVFLKEKGFDPEKQLCTDDFAGRLAHNTNLSIKAILVLGAYAQLCEQLGHQEEAEDFRADAEQMVKRWVKEAKDGDHFRLAFDRPGTWSMKYNLVWDKLLELNLFPASVMKTEMAFYLKKQERFGLPLDNRKKYAKLDWLVWIASMASGRGEFDALMGPVYEWVEKTQTRVPLTDHYWTDTGKQVVHWKKHGTGFQARSVVGGIYIPLLKSATLWGKYLAAAREESQKHHLPT
jgi:hypothetical protein